MARFSAFLKRHTLWLGFLAVLAPLVVLLALQFNSLAKLKSVSAIAHKAELHNYLEGALGVRRYRTLSLPSSVEAAEGYRELSPNDFVTHSPSELTRGLGGLPEVHEVREGPEISVIVRTKDRPQLLQEALASLAAGSYRRCGLKGGLGRERPK